MHTDLFKSRTQSIRLLILIATAVLVGRVLYLQMITDEYRDKAKATTIHKYVKYPARGLVADRNGKVVVNNDLVYDLMVTYSQINPSMDTARFCSLLGITREDFISRLSIDWSDKRYRKSLPIVFMSKLPNAVYARLQESLYEFQGFYTEARNVRSYPYRNAAHILGYISEVNQAQIEASDGYYQMRDYIGSSGLELAYEKELRGTKGYEYVLKDNLGRMVSRHDQERNIPPVSGRDLLSTLDIDLQEYGEKLMAGKVGAIVAIEPSSGEILTMVSSPSYDPNRLTITRHRGAAYQQLLQDSLKPLFNRALMAKYPPGSIFKPIMALIGMQTGAIRSNTGISCNFGYYYNGRTYGCHDHPYPADVPTSIQHSCNAYYFQTLRRIIDQYGYTTPQIGLDTLNKYLSRFGLGDPIGADVVSESGGNIPTSAYYDQIYPKEKGGWRSPTIMSIGIGQGEVELTTLQMANLAAVIANRGCYRPPHLVKAFLDGAPIPDQYTQWRCTGIDKAYFEPVIEGMSLVVRAGTGWVANIPDIEVCGKTGTSQNPHGEDHSVFFAFAPKENPQIAIAVYVENGGWGATYAAPISSLMIEKYLTDSISPSRQYLEERMLNANLIDQP